MALSRESFVGIGGVKLRRVIFFVQTRFSRQDCKRYGVDVLQHQGFEVEVWDFTFLVYPEIAGTSAVPLWSGHRIFQQEYEAVVAISRLGEDCFVFCEVGYAPESLWIFRAISRNRLHYGGMNIRGMPSKPSRGSNPHALLTRLLGLTPRRLMRSVFARIPYRFFGIAPAQLIVQGGTDVISAQLPSSPASRILGIHALDYDVYLKEREKPSETKSDVGVFLDGFWPLHPDFRAMGIASPTTVEGYYPTLRRFFDHLEKKHSVRIVIAAHPRANYGDRQDYFGGRPVIDGKTAELVRNAGFVIADASTSISYAVLFRKPALFVTTAEFEASDVGPWISRIASSLGKKVINIDKPISIDWKNELAIDEAAYAGYCSTYIKTPGTPEKPFWEILASHLKECDV